MALTAQLEEEIIQLMEDFWNSYFNGDMEGFASFLANDYKNIGTTREEVWSSRDEILAYTQEILPQMVGKAQMRNKKVEVIEMDTHLMVHEFGDIYVRSGETWEQYAEFRISTVLKQVEGTWKLWHQHGSYPDMRAMRGEAFGLDELRAENAKLQQAVEKRTSELKERNRDLEVEATLERIRSRTMAMHNTSEFREVIQLVYDQFIALGVHIEHTGFILDYPSRDDMHIWLADKTEVPNEIELPYFNTPHWNSFVETKSKGGGFFTNLLDAAETHTFYSQLFEHIPETSEEVRQFYLSRKGLAISTVLLDTVGLYIENFDGIPYTAEENEIVKRIGRVFQQTYTRFQDLQKAEAQAKEAEIELALERVRASTMAMHASEDLAEVASVLFEQMKILGGELFAFGIVLCDKHLGMVEQWHSLGDKGMLSPFLVPIDLDYIHQYRYDQWKSGEVLFSIEIPEEYIVTHFEMMFELPSVKRAMDEIARKGAQVEIPDWEIDYGASFKHGYLLVSSLKPFEDKHIFPRFANVFEQAYTRFLDLQKAEALAREAQIEAALERVRSRTMAMTHSDELAEASHLLDKEVRDLGIKTWGCAFNIYRENDSIEWFGNEAGLLPTYTIPRVGIFKEYYDRGQRGESIIIKEITGEDCTAHYEFMSTLPILGDVLRQLKESNGSFPDYQIDHVIYFKYGYLLFITREHVPEAYEIFKRFAQVFEQTYTRFLDLQKAEEQAREAQIELSLERIRAQVTAMKESSDLLDIVVTMRTEFTKLGHEAHYFWHMRWLPEIYQKAMTSGDGTRIGMVMELPRHIHGNIPLLAEWEKGEDPTVVYAMDTEDAIAYVDKMVSLGNFQQIDPQAPGPDDIRHIRGLTFVMARTTHGEIGFSLPGAVDEPPAEALDTLVRFAGVFDLAYRRFEDLKQAEHRNREAEIDLALEKLRSRTMAMQHSDEIPEVANLMFMEIQQLGIPAWSCGFNILADDKTSSVCLMSSEGTLQKPFDLPFMGEASFIQWHNFVKGEDELFVQELEGEAIVSHYDYMKSLPQLKPIFQDLQEAGLSLPSYQINHLCRFTHGFLLFITYEQVPEAHDIFKRFTSVFEQTYTRFLDLKNIEAQAREAKIETALERVRARALAMQEPEELKAVAEVLRKEMGLLGVEELETSSIYINDKEIDQAECWFAIKDLREDEKVMVTDYFELDLNDTWVGREMLKFYESSDEQVSIVMKGEERKEWISYCESRAELLNGYYGEVIPERTYHLYKFSNGAIGVATSGDLSEESWGLLKRAASTFSLAYSRFRDLTQARLDLQQLKEEKKRAEEALNELQLAQQQLVHAEKMASLGELTAGIAHEIKNPLNFVNNFSEVTHELVEEMIQEMQNGDTEEVDAIAKDIIQNLEKIVHHGQRADSIVRGMLQHSRSGDGQKEPTDLNALADEYLRLAYHGLRAKDKSFNATMETDFDASIGKVNMVPQDIGRVLLNLLTNAFHAVSERNQNQSDGYVPTVALRTRQSDRSIEITVTDNGGGIPKSIRDKIFQPFFTTKPTGQGTGLGLSMSYDIITKGHGGQLHVESEEGEGTSFTIILPRTPE